MRMDLQRAAGRCHLTRVFGGFRLRLDVDIHARLEHRRADLFNQRQHVLIAVDDIGTMVLHREHDAVVLGHLAELAHGLDDELTAVAFPKPVLVIAVGIVVSRQAVIERDPAPCGEDLADWRAQVVREFDALAHVADHGFALNGHGARKVAIRRDRAQLDSELAGEIAQAAFDRRRTGPSARRGAAPRPVPPPPSPAVSPGAPVETHRPPRHGTTPRGT